MATANITQASSSVVLDLGLWAGTRDGSTSWLNGIAGVSAGDAEGGLKLLVVDLVCASASTLTKLNFSDTTITGVSGTTALAILGIQNLSGGFEEPTIPTIVSGEVQFTTAGSTAGDTHRLTILYA
jgi:hypothetical protein